MITLKKILIVISAALFLLSASSIYAHSVVTPKEVGIGSFQDFSVSVPSEKDANTISIRLILPQGLVELTPAVKPGWKITVKGGSNPTEIDWTGGSIPSGQKDIFIFSAQVPSKSAELDWKIYQTYSDKSVVAWTLGPNDPEPKDKSGNEDFSTSGPYPKTLVIDDFKSPVTNSNSSPQNNFPLLIGTAALALSVLSLTLQFKRNGKKS
jgi:uncharacterized protein YcnI